MHYEDFIVHFFATKSTLREWYAAEIPGEVS